MGDPFLAAVQNGGFRFIGSDEEEKPSHLFDLADDWWHDLTVLKIMDGGDAKGYPKIVKKVGESPNS